MMDKKSANGFPSKASESGGQRKQLPYSVETPYGFHLDLDFLKYVDDIEKGNTIKRVHIQRKNRGPKYSTLPRNFSLPGHGARPAAKDTWANTSTLGSKPKSRVTEVQQLFEFRARDGSAGGSSGSTSVGHSKVQSSGYISSPKTSDEVHIQASCKEQQLGLNVRPHLFRASSMPVNVPHRKASDSADEQSPQSQNGSTERLFRPVDSSDRRGSIPQDRTSLHQQITAALKRVRELEELVRTIPELKAQICSLREEKEQLLLRIQEQSERKVGSREKPQAEAQDSSNVATQQQEVPSLSQDTICGNKTKIPVAEPTTDPQVVGQALVAQNLAEQEAAETTVSGEKSVPAVVSVPVILIEKAESPTDSEESEKQLIESEHKPEIPKRFSEQGLEKQKETPDAFIEDKQSELSEGFLATEEQGEAFECTAFQGETEKTETSEVSVIMKDKVISATNEQESLIIQELQVKVKTLEERLSQANCELEKTDSLLRVEREENRSKDAMIQELSEKVKETIAKSIEQETAVPLNPELTITCDASVSTDTRTVSEKSVLTDVDLYPEDGPKEINLMCSSTQTIVIQMQDAEVSAQVMTTEKVVGVEVATCDQAVETDVPISPSGAVHVGPSEAKADEQSADVRYSTDEEDMVSEKISEKIITESDVAEGYVIVEKAESYMVETVVKENIVFKSQTVKNELAESVNVENVVTQSSKEETSTGQSQHDQKQAQGQDTQPQPQPQRPTESATSPAAIGQVVNRIQGLLNEQWASLGSGSQEGKGESSQKQPVSKISSIQSHLRGSLSALSAFYSPVQKGGAAKQSGLKSIMKKNDYPEKQGNGGVKKNLKFVGVNGGYETTSSEESSGEENEDEGEEKEEVDSSEPEEQGEEKEIGAAQDEAAAAGEQADEAQAKGSECSEEPKDPQANIGPQEEQPSSEFVDKNFMAACHYLKDRMAEVPAPNKEMRQILMVLYQEWFRVSSQKDSQAETVTLYLREVGNQTPTLLRYIVNLADGNGNMALHYSVSHSNFPVVKLLLDTGLCEVDHQNKAGYTAIMLAALTAAEGPDDMEVAQQLLSLGNINARASQSGQTALMLAVSHGRTAMVQVLLECKADVNIQDQDGSTALMCASEHGHTEIAKLLLDTPDCDTSLTDKVGHTAMSVAVKGSHSEIVNLLKAQAETAITEHTTSLI